MRHQTWACALGLTLGSAVQAQPCNDAFKSSGNFLSGSRYATQASLPGVAAEQAFQRALRFTADHGFTVQSADPKTGQIRAAQSAQLAKGKQAPLDITLRDEAGGAVIALSYATGAGQLSPESAIRDHFCKTVAAAATAGADEAAPVASPASTPAPVAAAPAPARPVAQAAPLTLPETEFIRHSQPCMSGLCLGDTIAQLPKSVRWEPFNPNLPASTRPIAWKRVARAENVDRLATTIKGPRASLEKLDTGITAQAFNAEELQALTELQAVCRPTTFKVVAHFKSASGHPTTVNFEPGVSEAGQLQFRVSQIVRHYPTAISLDQQREVMAAAEQQYRPLMQAKQAAKDLDRSRLANVAINRSPVSVHLFESIWVRDGHEQPLLKHPACGGAAAIKLD